jgi:eukaryotic-like serine/threonine-protein kinase
MIAPVNLVAVQDRCDSRLLTQLANDTLSESELAIVSEHLNDCVACQMKLDSMHRSDSAWDASRPTVYSHLHRSVDESNLAENASDGLSVSNISSKMNPSSVANKALLRWLESCDQDAIDQGYIGLLDGYLVRRIVGTGGMGIVLEGWEPSLHRTVAIKVMHPHLASIAVARQRFIREARAAAAVVHPNVVPIHSVHAEFDPPYLVMPLIAGESLQARIDRVGPLDLGSMLRIASQIADGLQAAHAHGLVHRDVKPANILVEFGTERAMLTDFGVVRALDDATMTNSGSIAGTPEYMSPEQATGAPLDFRSDFFSLGSVMYAMLAGRSPFRAESALGVLRRVSDDVPRPLKQLNPQLPVWAVDLIRWLHQKSPEDRPATSEAFSTAIRAGLSHWNAPEQFAAPKCVFRRRLSSKAIWIMVGVATIALAPLVVLPVFWTKPHPDIVPKASSMMDPKPIEQFGGTGSDELESSQGIEIEAELESIESQIKLLSLKKELAK